MNLSSPAIFHNHAINSQVRRLSTCWNGQEHTRKWIRLETQVKSVTLHLHRGRSHPASKLKKEYWTMKMWATIWKAQKVGMLWRIQKKRWYGHVVIFREALHNYSCKFFLGPNLCTPRDPSICKYHSPFKKHPKSSIKPKN